jgi:hypothetical protein
VAIAAYWHDDHGVAVHHVIGELSIFEDLFECAARVECTDDTSGVFALDEFPRTRDLYPGLLGELEERRGQLLWRDFEFCGLAKVRRGNAWPDAGGKAQEHDKA